jgi:hypothetical protein
VQFATLEEHGEEYLNAVLKGSNAAKDHRPDEKRDPPGAATVAQKQRVEQIGAESGVARLCGVWEAVLVSWCCYFSPCPPTPRRTGGQTGT